jgi:hypothetical protein
MKSLVAVHRADQSWHTLARGNIRSPGDLDA